MNSSHNQYNIEYEDQELQHTDLFVKNEPTKMTEWVIRHSSGLIKKESQANLFLLIIAIVMILLSFFFFTENSKKNKVPQNAIQVLTEKESAKFTH